jgi:hypothetical protein
MVWLGWGKLSGSIDEFRYWKVRRTSEEIKKITLHKFEVAQILMYPMQNWVYITNLMKE